MYIYVAGPYTNGAPDGNVRAAVDAAEQLRKMGHTPFVPHLNFLWGMVHQHGYEYWMDWCLEWVDRCDALLRIDGHSPGGDREVKYAHEQGMPVYESVDEVNGGDLCDAVTSGSMNDERVEG